MIVLSLFFLYNGVRNRVIALKIKGVVRKNWERVETSYTKVVHVNYQNTVYYISATYFDKIRSPKWIKVKEEEVCILKDYYMTIQILPVGKNYVVTAWLDDKGTILQWYFDITARNFIGEDQLPYFEDLYLDVTFDLKDRMIVLDENELKEAYEQKIITPEQFALVYQELDKIVENVRQYKEALIKVSDRWYHYFIEIFHKELEKAREEKEEEIHMIDSNGNLITKKNQVRKYIYPGLRVKIVLKKDQPTGILTEGTVMKILTHSPIHHQGIKVMLEDGRVGRVQEIIQ